MMSHIRPCQMSVAMSCLQCSLTSALLMYTKMHVCGLWLVSGDHVPRVACAVSVYLVGEAAVLCYSCPCTFRHHRSAPTF